MVTRFRGFGKAHVGRGCDNSVKDGTGLPSSWASARLRLRNGGLAAVHRVRRLVGKEIGGGMTRRSGQVRWRTCLAAGIGLAAYPAAASELVLKPGEGHIILARINSQPVRLRVDPESPGYVILNRDAAWRLRLYPTLVSAAVIIGPVRVPGSSRVARVVVGDVTSTRRVMWTDREAVQGADGIISPADIPVDRVTLRFGPPALREARFEFPMSFSPTIGLFHRQPVGDGFVDYRISTGRSVTVATAAAGALLAREYGGAWSGEARELMIKYGIVRPVRPLELDRPSPFANQTLIRLLVRTSDHRGTAELPTDPNPDPDEIVVTGQRGRQQARYMISLGLDWLRPCSSVTWNNRTRRMTLSCATEQDAAAPAA